MRLVITLNKGALDSFTMPDEWRERRNAKRPTLDSVMDYLAWNAANPGKPKDERGRWTDSPIDRRAQGRGLFKVDEGIFVDPKDLGREHGAPFRNEYGHAIVELRSREEHHATMQRHAEASAAEAAMQLHDDLARGTRGAFDRLYRRPVRYVINPDEPMYIGRGPLAVTEKAALVIDLAKRRGKSSGLDWRGWNAANKRQRGPDGRWQGSGGASTVATAVRKLTGHEALQSVPARLDDDGLGRLNPRHVPGTIAWREGHIPSWDSVKRRALTTSLEDYRGADFSPLNKKLRGMPYRNNSAKFDGNPRGFERHIVNLQDNIDTVMAQSRLTDTIEVWRGTNTGKGIFGDAIDGDDVTGFEWTELAYTSTSANEEIVKDFTISGLKMKITVPAGVGAVALSKWMGKDYFDPDKDVPNEAEVLLERGLKFRVVSDTGKPASYHDTRTLEIEVIA